MSPTTRATVLAYHSISDGPPPLCVSASRFEAQLDLLERAGLEAVPLTAIVERLEKGEPFERPCFALTFDDAYADFAEAALPILERRRLAATLFATASERRDRLPGGIAGARLLPLDALADVARRGVEIGAHSVDHVDLTRLDARALDVELDACRERLEERSGAPVEHFAYPFGRFDARVRAAVARRFRSAATTRLARVRAGDDAHAIPRVDAHYLRSPLLRLGLAAGRPDAYLRVRRRLRVWRGSEARTALKVEKSSARIPPWRDEEALPCP